MKIATITGVGDQSEVRIYEHDAASLEDSRASSDTFPRDWRLIGTHHFGGMPRWRHFFRAKSLTPSCSAALSTKVQSSCVMSIRCRDDLSRSQATTSLLAGKDNLSILSIMKELTTKEFNQAYRLRIRAAREAKGWGQEEMAGFMGVPYATYKKWETRSPMPLSYCEKFAALTGTDHYYLTTGRDSTTGRLVRRNTQ